MNEKFVQSPLSPGLEELFENDVIPAAEAIIFDLREKAKELIACEMQIKDLEEAMAAISKRANVLKSQIIPDKMDELGIPEFKTDEGYKIAVDDFVSGSLPKENDRREAALEKIVAWGSEAVIKTELSVVFEKSEHDKAVELAKMIKDRGLECELKSGVHAQTYLSLIRERLRSGGSVDPEVMNIFIGRRAKVTAPKVKS